MKRTVSALVALLALCVVGIQSAHATLILLVTESGGVPIPIVDNGPLDDNLIDPGVITVKTALLNLSLTNFQFSALGAQSNVLTGTPFSDEQGTLDQTGAAVRTGTAGVQTLFIEATDTDYLFPDGNPKFLDSSGSVTFRNTTGSDSSTFQSFFDPGNVPFATTIPSPLLAFLAPTGAGPFSDGDDAPSTPLGAQPIPYSLTNQTLITLGANATSTGIRSAQFAGSTIVTAVPQVIPEPSSFVLFGAGLLGLVATVRRRRKTG